jgi:TPR repeat protein
MSKSTRHALHIFTIAALLLVSATGCANHTRSGWRAYEAGDYATALAEWTPLAEQGDADAQYLVGLMHDDGQGVPVNHREAARWYILSAEQGYAAAQNNLGALYYAGEGVERSTDEAVKWFGSAAAQGFALAQGNLGVLRMLGQTAAQARGALLAKRLAPDQAGAPDALASAATREGAGAGTSAALSALTSR